MSSFIIDFLSEVINTLAHEQLLLTACKFYGAYEQLGIYCAKSLLATKAVAEPKKVSAWSKTSLNNSELRGYDNYYLFDKPQSSLSLSEGIAKCIVSNTPNQLTGF